MKKTVCITGASQGIGFGLVEAFLNDETFEVVAVTRSLDKLKSKIEHKHLQIVACDISTEAGRQTLFDTIKEMPPLSVLIHNAGKLLFKPFAEITEKELTTVYNVNVFAPFLLTQKLLPLMTFTHTIHISSVGGVEGSVKFPGLSAYSSSKAALNCLTEMLSEEFKETNNVFNCLALGSVNTEMFAEAFPGAQAASSVSEMAAYIYDYALRAPSVMRGKIISLSKSNP
jgi:NAD(P)-dependent dehydrogenase (short-subunit alcohol dehydrogenase family)